MFLVQQAATIARAVCGRALSPGGVVSTSPLLAASPSPGQSGRGLLVEEPAARRGPAAGCWTPAHRLFVETGPTVKPIRLHKISPVRLTTE